LHFALVYYWRKDPATLHQRLRPIRKFGLDELDRESRRADSNRWPSILRVIGRALQRFAQECKSCISKRLSLLQVAERCTVLRSRWCQSGIKSLSYLPNTAVRFYSLWSKSRQLCLMCSTDSLRPYTLLNLRLRNARGPSQGFGSDLLDHFGPSASQCPSTVLWSIIN
jgi:hypothetical protein